MQLFTKTMFRLARERLKKERPALTRASCTTMYIALLRYYYCVVTRVVNIFTGIPLENKHESFDMHKCQLGFIY